MDVRKERGAVRRYAVVVDPLGTGQEFPAEFRAAAVEVVAVMSLPEPIEPYLSSWKPENFEHIHQYDGDLEGLAAELREYRPLCLIAGAETGVELADALVELVVPGTGHDPALAPARRDKWEMAKAVRRAGVPHLRQFCSDDPDRIDRWLRATGLDRTRVVVKPPKSGGTDNVHIVDEGKDWRPLFDEVYGKLNEFELRNDAVLVQEYADGPEFLLDSYSVDGRHGLVDACRYTKVQRGDRIGVYDLVDFIEPDHPDVLATWPYARQVLDALGVRNGPCHIEVILTAAGPRLIEVGARPAGGGHQMISELATGSNHLIRTVQHRVYGRFEESYRLVQHVCSVVLTAPHAGRWVNGDLFDGVDSLPTFWRKLFYFTAGEQVPGPAGMASMLGWVVLASPDRAAMYADYRQIKSLERQIQVTEGDQMTGMTLTDAYLAAVAEHGPSAAEVLEGAKPSVTDTMYMGRSLTRPVFLDRDEIRGLTADLDLLFSALTGLPERIFGGDLAAFGRAVGLAEPQVRAVVRGRGPAPSRMARADLYKDETGFHLLEVNMGSNVGGLDNTELNLAMLEHPFIAGFVAGHGLTYVETMPELVETLLVEAKVPTGVRPFVAITDWPDSYPDLKDQLLKSSRLLAPLGLDCQPCSIEELTYHDERVWLGDRPVDVVYRLFMVEDLVKPGAEELAEPVLRAAERDQVAIFSPMDSDVFGSKGALALLSDEAYRDRYSAAELAALDRLVPWTRMVRPGPVTVGAEQHDLVHYAERNQSELVLKPVAEHAGQGVVLGWETDESSWRAGVRQAMDGPYILQQRIRAVPEAFPTDDGTEDWLLTWGALTVASGYGGMWVRGARATESGVVNMATGATATCCFHQE